MTIYFFKIAPNPTLNDTQRHDILWLQKKPVPFLKDRGGKSQDWCQKHEADLCPYQRVGRNVDLLENTSKYSMGLGLVYLPTNLPSNIKHIYR